MPNLCIRRSSEEQEFSKEVVSQNQQHSSKEIVPQNQQQEINAISS
jgi:hypothetical protein